MRTFKTILVVVPAVMSIVSASDAIADDRDYEAAIANMAVDPAMAEKMVFDRHDAVGLMDRMLFLFAFKPDDTDRNNDIRALQAQIDGETSSLTDDFERDVVGPTVPFDGTASSLGPTIILASSSGYATTESAFYAIPCAILQNKPELTEATEPMFGGNRDNFLPRSGCVWGRGEVAGYPINALNDYMAAAERATGGMFDPGQGTIRFAQAAAQQADVQTAMLNPDALQSAPTGTRQPFQMWSYLSWANRHTYTAISAAAVPVSTALRSYWQENGKSPVAVDRIVRETLFGVVYGADCQTVVPSSSVRVMLIEGHPIAEIEKIAQQGKGHDANLFEKCAAFGGIDGLLHVAVARPNSLDVLWGNGYFPDVEARNEFGKTALMTASQLGNVDAVKWLLAHGANVEARTIAGDEWVYPRHGRRTAIHYGAASGDIDVVKVLIAAGAKVDALDDVGFSAQDYLMGRDDLPGNASISDKDRAALLNLITPQ